MQSKCIPELLFMSHCSFVMCTKWSDLHLNTNNSRFELLLYHELVFIYALYW